MEQNKKQTAVELLFKEFKTLSENSRFAGDNTTANLIDFLCERESVALEKEKEQIINAYWNGIISEIDNHDELPTDRAEQYYKETYETNSNS